MVGENSLTAILAVLTLLLTPSLCDASYIQMTLSAQFPQIITEKNTTIKYTILNSGDEPAYDVQLSPLLPEGFTAEEDFIGVLNPNIPYEGKLYLNIDDSVKAGT
jgi:hypothetical protein